jgi:hypothetical protein
MTGEWWRRERATTAAAQATAATSSPMKLAEPHPHPGTLTSASATRPTDAASIAAPTRSGLPWTCSSLLSGTTRLAISTAASPTGRLIQKTHRQLNCTRLPPITGPRAAPSAPRADQVPMACERAAGGTEASSKDSDAGTIRPAPTACTTRAAISRLTPGASPQHSDPAQNASRPATNSRRRPTRSAQRPAGTRTAANTIV